MAATYMPQVHRSWVHQAHTATRAASRSPSPDPDGKDKREDILSAEQGMNSRLAVDMQEQDFLRHMNRGDHLPSRGAHAEQARVMRNMYGYAPIGSMYDAQELSSEEEKWDAKRVKVANFGKRHFIKFGNTRTLQEEENSIEEDAAHRQGLADDSTASDAEGGPGVFIGGHTGHAAANLAAQRRAQADATARGEQANQPTAAVVTAERGGAAAAGLASPPAAEALTEGDRTFPDDDSFEQRDMDADIEDLDAE
ncbi:hypothetical protein K437DRAFT_253855 [Tilletiaria anomala UBC 951]|uniref:Uncharacterized protein n=1 Tax=Tilletiaria anomala (strain ATCC 24038 / CBS 436.72 / UBC 951) TaxID=1037660 RepID=A0A066WFT6_TILAU|nr:uncharacterized protein K437DRAFT_253855 [Tilletiaria anomala UBC 951]KDN52666.1 hypothetical protein K437DRAFT_253855 [Tilletiaria anomala UBC 951]